MQVIQLREIGIGEAQMGNVTDWQGLQEEKKENEREAKGHEKEKTVKQKEGEEKEEEREEVEESKKNLQMQLVCHVDELVHHEK